ncbi:hypothetical protein Y032_0056g2632, partial [Ancylostoma ceylanicum]
MTDLNGFYLGEQRLHIVVVSPSSIMFRKKSSVQSNDSQSSRRKIGACESRALEEMRAQKSTGAKMGESEVEMKETPPAAPPPTAPPPTPPAPTAPPPTAQHPSVPTIAEEGGDVDVTPGPTPRVASAENLPHTGGRRISSVEAVKGAPPPKRTSVVVFETPDVRKPSRKTSSWWRNLVMDDDKVSGVPTPEIVVTNENQGANGALDEHHRNISTISMGD